MIDLLRELRSTDTGVAFLGAWFMVGWLFGLAFAVAMWWRPITRNRSESASLRLLRMQLEDSDRQLGGALQAADRMANEVSRLSAELAGRRVA